MKSRPKINGIVLLAAIMGVIFIFLGSGILFNTWVDNVFLSLVSFWKGRPPIPLWTDKLHLIGEGILIIGSMIMGYLLILYWDNKKQTRFETNLELKWSNFKQNNVVRIMAPIGAIIFIGILITIKSFSFAFMGNETDVLPSIRQFVDHA
jgi:hypothetical protein